MAPGRALALYPHSPASLVFAFVRGANRCHNGALGTIRFGLDANCGELGLWLGVCGVVCGVWGVLGVCVFGVWGCGVVLVLLSLPIRKSPIRARHMGDFGVCCV